MLTNLSLQALHKGWQQCTRPYPFILLALLVYIYGQRRRRLRGEQFLDLEGLANHRGSAFGSMGQAPQPSNEADAAATPSMW